MTSLLCHRLLVPLTGAKANSHNKIVIPTEAKRSGGTCGLLTPKRGFSLGAVHSRRRVEGEITPATRALGGPFKPYFDLSGLGCLPDTLSLGEAVTFLVNPPAPTRLPIPVIARPLPSKTGWSTVVASHV